MNNNILLYASICNYSSVVIQSLNALVDILLTLHTVTVGKSYWLICAFIQFNLHLKMNLNV